jgi:hypothetical protein
VARLLIRASKSPFENFFDGPAPREAYAPLVNVLDRPGTMNTGNLVFAHSVYKVLDTPDADIEIDNYQLSLSDDFARRAARINETYDAFVIPLANIFRPEYRATLSRITRNLKRIRIPCVVTGMGAQAAISGEASELRHMDAEVKDFIATVLDRSASVGVRGEVTRNYLVRLGFSDDQVDVIGCPSMFYNGTHMNVTKKADLGEIAFNYTEGDDSRLDPFTSYFAQPRPGVTYVPQVRSVIRTIVDGSESRDRVGDNSARGLDIRAYDESDQIVFFTDIMPWMDFLRTQSFSVGTRIHGNIVALLAGTPAHVIVHDSRTRELAEYFQVPMTPVTHLGEFDPVEAFGRSNYDGVNRGHGERVATYARFLERNGLQHILYDDAALAVHDARVRASLHGASLPSPSRPSTGFRLRRGLRRRLNRLRGRV